MSSALWLQEPSICVATCEWNVKFDTHVKRVKILILYILIIEFLNRKQED
jgi:hypothetical protein